VATAPVAKAGTTVTPEVAHPTPAVGRRPSNLGPDPFQLALYHQRAGDFEQALVSYKALLQRDEMNIEAHNNLGYLYLGKGLLDEAAREFQRVIAIEPKYVTAHVNLSATFYKLERFGAAAAQAREALALDHYRLFLQYAGPEQSDYAEDVRQRLPALSARIR
jgi:tetratricopeptide (TPR) repeat protein